MVDRSVNKRERERERERNKGYVRVLKTLQKNIYSPYSKKEGRDLEDNDAKFEWIGKLLLKWTAKGYFLQKTDSTKEAIYREAQWTIRLRRRTSDQTVLGSNPAVALR